MCKQWIPGSLAFTTPAFLRPAFLFPCFESLGTRLVLTPLAMKAFTLRWYGIYNNETHA